MSPTRVKLRHGDVSYTLMREQTYRKDYSNRVKGDNTVFDIAKKDSNGNTSYVKKSQCESEVKGILPKELSRYFFFDGERIEKMSKDISTGKKATDFADAVNRFDCNSRGKSIIDIVLADRCFNGFFTSHICIKGGAVNIQLTGFICVICHLAIDWNIVIRRLFLFDRLRYLLRFFSQQHLELGVNAVDHLSGGLADGFQKGQDLSV